MHVFKQNNKNMFLKLLHGVNVCKHESDVDNLKLSKYITDREFFGAILEWDSFSLHIKMYVNIVYASLKTCLQIPLQTAEELSRNLKLS